MSSNEKESHAGRAPGWPDLNEKVAAAKTQTAKLAVLRERARLRRMSRMATRRPRRRALRKARRAARRPR